MVGSLNGHIYAFSLDGSRRWDAQAPGGVVALSSRDGSVLWIADLHSAVFSAPAIAGDTLVVGDSRGDVIAYRPA